MAPFVVSAADSSLYGSFDVPQQFLTDIADCCAKRVDRFWGREIVDSLKILFVKPPLRFKSAAFQHHIGGTDGCGTFELHLLSSTIIVHEQRIVNDAENVGTVILPIICDTLSNNICNLLTENVIADAVFFGQHPGNRFTKIIVQFPEIRNIRPVPRPGIGQIEHIAQTRIAAGFIQQGDALRTFADITVHSIVPEIERCAGRGRWPLGVDHQLVDKTVLVQSGRSCEKICPMLPVPRDAIRCPTGKFKIFLGFRWH